MYLIGSLLSPFLKRNDPPRPEFDRVIPLFGRLSILSTSCSCVLVSRLGGESLSLSSSSRGAFSNTFLRLPRKLPPLAELFLGSLLAGRRRFSSTKGMIIHVEDAIRYVTNKTHHMHIHQKETQHNFTSKRDT